MHITLIFLTLLIAVKIHHKARAQQIKPIFTDVSIEAGMLRPHGKRIKYGGAAVADLNGDGYLDFLCTHHTENSTDLYINNADGSVSFTRSDWNLISDVHGINPFRFSPSQLTMSFLVSRGGRQGTKANYPYLYEVNTQGQVSKIDEDSVGLLPYSAGRGRTAVFINLNVEDRHKVSVIVTNAPMSETDTPQRAFELSEDKQFEYKQLLGGFENESNQHASVMDINNDGFMEVLSYQDLRMYYLENSYKLVEITNDVLPRHLSKKGTSSVTEFDYNNDGLMDLYITRSNDGYLDWRQRSNANEGTNDILLKNIGGKFIDVSIESGIPTDTKSQGVTSGDFNNDGWMDLLISIYDLNKPDLLLLNRGDGTFAIHNANLFRESTISGDKANAVDINRDGRLDLIVSEGDWFHTDLAGYYRIMNNVTPDVGNYLLIRVGNSPSRNSTSLHSIAQIQWKNNWLLSRRVGGSAGTAVSISYVEVLHFGVGDVAVLEKVSVRWTGGEVQIVENVNANQLVTFGAI